MKSGLVPALVLALICASQASLGGERPIVALFDVEDRGSVLEARVRSDLTDYLAARLAESGYRVIPRDQILERLKQQQKESYKECYDQICQIELGRELAAQKSLSTRILKIAGTCQVSATLYDLRQSTTEKAANVESTCNEKSLLGAFKSLADKLALEKTVVSTESTEPVDHDWFEVGVHGYIGGDDFIGKSDNYNVILNEEVTGRVDGRMRSSGEGLGVKAGVRLGSFHLVFARFDFLMDQEWFISGTDIQDGHAIFSSLRFMVGYRFAYPVFEWLEPFAETALGVHAFLSEYAERTGGGEVELAPEGGANFTWVVGAGLRFLFPSNFFVSIYYLTDIPIVNVSTSHGAIGVGAHF